MPRRDVHYGWKVSPYSAKTRSYLKHIGATVLDVEPSVLKLMRQIRPAVGAAVMPTIQKSDGSWLRDSSLIIDHYESLRTESITPECLVTAFASSLLEVFADEWLPMAALHYRWHSEENMQFALNDFARSGLPWLPKFIGRRVVRPFANKMRGYLPILGVNVHSVKGVEITARLTLDTLEKQLNKTSFIFGDAPTLGDFSLYGPLWAHLYRDPGSRYLFEETPAVVDWLRRLTDGLPSPKVEVTFDEVPEALDPLFACIFEDQWAWINTLVTAIDEYCDAHPDAKRVPRALGSARFQVRGIEGQRKLVTFVQWKAQRARRAYEACEGSADFWIRRVLRLDATADVSTVVTPIQNPLTMKDFAPVLTDRIEQN